MNNLTPILPPIGITGLGIVSAIGLGLKENRRILSPHFSAPALDPQLPLLRVVPPENWAQKLSVPAETLLVNLMALAATLEALESADMDPASLRSLRVGVCLGSTIGCSNFQFDFIRQFCLGEKPKPDVVYEYFKSNTAQFISRHFGWKGPAQMVSNACTSGADAIGIGASWLKADLCDVVICGGTELALVSMYAGFRSLQLCAPQLCKPFDRKRQGLTLGEGAGILILEKGNSPRPSKAQLLGYGTASDAYHPTAPHPEARGLTTAAQIAFAQAGLRKVDFINAHGTATSHNDLAEGYWIRNFAPQTTVVATKGYTGHALAASGAIEAVLTAMSLMEQTLPASRGFEEMDPEIGLTPTTEILEGDFKTALSLSLGFGGTNAALCLGRA